jgi:predicted secreted hydrolase
MAFPEAHGPHPDYQTEWWYYTGNLETEDGRHFGYQMTIFRRALTPASEQAQRTSEWATNQVYFAHFTLTDVQAGQFHEAERFGRGAAGIAGAQSEPFRVWIENLSIEQTDDDTYQLTASHEDITLTLTLHDAKGPVLEGDQGYSQKGPDPGNASIYYSMTRLESNGTISIGDASYEVSGLSWMDHEYGTSALAENVIGWDWFSIQLDDGSELMLYHFRRKDGTIDAYSNGLYIAPDGSTTPLSLEDFTITVEDSWTSPHSHAEYPAKWMVAIPSLGVTLHLTPYLADQELNVSSVYWEGAVKITGERGGQIIAGSGYVEMTGYSGSMSGKV